jgi:hypothetical protein
VASLSGCPPVSRVPRTAETGCSLGLSSLSTLSQPFSYFGILLHIHVLCMWVDAHERRIHARPNALSPFSVFVIRLERGWTGWTGWTRLEFLRSFVSRVPWTPWDTSSRTAVTCGCRWASAFGAGLTPILSGERAWARRNSLLPPFVYCPRQDGGRESARTPTDLAPAPARRDARGSVRVSAAEIEPLAIHGSLVSADRSPRDAFPLPAHGECDSGAADTN